MISVSFVVKKIGEVCGYISIPDKDGIYRQFAVIPMSGVNNCFGGYASIILAYNDDEEYQGGLFDVYGHQVQAVYEEDNGDVTDVLDLHIFLNEKAD
jgi:hypothetical protein